MSSTQNIPSYPTCSESQMQKKSHSEPQLTKEKTKYFLFGLLVGSTVVACIKDDSETIKEIGSAITKIATSYYGCKFIYRLIS